MPNGSSQTLEARLASATQRVAQLKARQLLRDMRATARMKARQRRADFRRRLDLGGTVIAAGVGDWEDDEILGLLLDGRDRALGSATVRLSMRKRGQSAFRPRAKDIDAVSRAPASQIPLHLPPDENLS